MLQVQNLTCERQQRLLFQELSFGAAAGELWQVRGANGAGKTTLLRILAGFYQDYEGQVSWQTEDWPLFVGHKSGVKEHLTCMENLRWLMQLHDHHLTDDALESALQTIGLAGYEQQLAHSLSEGQRKRVSLARLIVSQSPVWILDEPLSAIDVAGVQLLEDTIADHLLDDGLVILTSHQTPALQNVQVLDL